MKMKDKQIIMYWCRTEMERGKRPGKKAQYELCTHKPSWSQERNCWLSPIGSIWLSFSDSQVVELLERHSEFRLGGTKKMCQMYFDLPLADSKPITTEEEA